MINQACVLHQVLKYLLDHSSKRASINNRGQETRKKSVKDNFDEHQDFFKLYTQCISSPSVSGSSLYPTSFLSTGTMMPAPWNVLVTTFGVKRVLNWSTIAVMHILGFERGTLVSVNHVVSIMVHGIILISCNGLLF